MKYLIIIFTLLTSIGYSQDSISKKLDSGQWFLTQKLDSAAIFSLDTLAFTDMANKCTSIALTHPFLVLNAKEKSFHFMYDRNPVFDTDGKLKKSTSKMSTGKWDFVKETNTLNLKFSYRNKHKNFSRNYLICELSDQLVLIRQR